MTRSKRPANLVCFLVRPLAAVFVLASFAGTAHATPATLPACHPLVENSLSDFALAGSASFDGSAQIVTVSDAPGFTEAIRAQIKKRETNEYDLECELKLPSVSLHDGDVIWASVWARMLRTEDESGQGILGFVLEQSREPFNKLIHRRISIGPQWQQLAVPARVHGDQAAGSLHLALRLGAAAQSLEMGGVQLVRFDDPSAVDLNQLPQTRVTYGGREPDASWRKSADERIDQIRKAPLTVRVVDAAGHPVAGAHVVVEMRQHAFPFGCVYNPRLIPGPDGGTTGDAEYARRFAGLFNVGIDEFAMKWQAWETPATRDIAIKALDWMNDHCVRVRGHCLVWPGWRHLPTALAALKGDPAALAKRVNDHIRDEVTALRGRVTEWDVINEPYANNDLMKTLGYGAMADWFKTAHDADPAARLVLNETSVPTNPPGDQHYDVLFRQVQALQKEGAPIGAVGMQGHFESDLTSIEDLRQIYGRFASLDVPVEITELDIDVNDEQLQADYLRDFMTFSFSQPNISGINLWGFVENHHWRPDAALWHAGWQIKPAGQAWLDLVKKKWWTRADLNTDADGTASIRGFLGSYQLTASRGSQSQAVHATLPPGGGVVEIVLR